MVDAIPLVTEYNKGRLHTFQSKRVPTSKGLQAALWVEYGCALRVTEMLTLTKDDFDFNDCILTLNHTKTGFEKCKCSKWKKRKLLSSDKNCADCQGLGKYRVPQFTSIPPDLPKWVKEYVSNEWGNELCFPFTRQLMWSYLKKAAQFVNLEMGEQQKRRKIKGAWTHLLRKSWSKRMKFLGASRELRMCKLRHSFTDAQDAYDVEDINALIEWESVHIKGS